MDFLEKSHPPFFNVICVPEPQEEQDVSVVGDLVLLLFDVAEEKGMITLTIEDISLMMLQTCIFIPCSHYRRYFVDDAPIIWEQGMKKLIVDASGNLPPVVNLLVSKKKIT
jgi:hypothetical protein